MFAGAFGGGLWLLLLEIVVPPEEKHGREWWLAVTLFTGFWLVVGFLVGAYGLVPPKGSAQDDPGRREPGSWLTVIFVTLGRLLYRVLVGYLVGSIVTCLCAGPLVGMGFLFGDYAARLKDTGQRLVIFAAISAFMASVWGGQAGGVFAALVVDRRSTARARIIKWAFIGAVLGFLLATCMGAIVGIACNLALGDDGIRRMGESFIHIPMAAGLIVGALAGAYAGFLSRLQFSARGSKSALDREVPPVS